jgi:nicotinate phosphoribosyltransferase
MAARALSTDLYQLTMAAGYVGAGRVGRATFELFVRRLPASRAFLVAAGLEQALEYLETLRFSADEIAYLRTVAALQPAPATFFDEYLPRFRFTGDVWAMPEGTPVFAGEPLLRVTASLPEAQVAETALLSLVDFQTAVASRALRVVVAAGGRPVVEFGARRSHGPEAGALAARAAYLAGCAGTSNVEAGRLWNIPLFGTMAHSWVLAAPDELTAFREFEAMYGDHAVLVLDTFDTLAALDRIITAGLKPAAVRLDSGNLAMLARETRRRLDAAGLESTRIFASGDLDERRIADLIGSGTPVDGFGVGAAISAVTDAPSLGAVYKLVALQEHGAARPVMKLSPDKQTWPGAKQVWRIMRDGLAVGDVVGLAEERGPDGGLPLLMEVMRNGCPLAPTPPLPDVRARCASAVGTLPVGIRRLWEPLPYPVERSGTLAALARRAADTMVTRRA